MRGICPSATMRRRSRLSITYHKPLQWREAVQSIECKTHLWTRIITYMAENITCIDFLWKGNGGGSNWSII